MRRLNVLYSWKTSLGAVIADSGKRGSTFDDYDPRKKILLAAVTAYPLLKINFLTILVTRCPLRVEDWTRHDESSLGSSFHCEDTTSEREDEQQ